MSQIDKPIKLNPIAWVAAVLVVATAVFAWSRVGLLDLPSVSSSVTEKAAGLGDLASLKQTDDSLWTTQASSNISPAVRTLREGLAQIKDGQRERGLETMRTGIRLDANNLALTNAYRMTAFRLRREFLHEAKQTNSPTPTFPPYLEKEPIAFFEALCKENPTRERKLQLALAWVDLMLLFPALEIKAPASVEAVKILTTIIDQDDAFYVPALFARGLNHLHRPARLVWPEADKTPIDAAAQDIGRCIAVGRKLGVGSSKLQATLALALGDSYVKAGRFSVARSWWQIAQNLSRDDGTLQAVRRRFAWKDEEILDRLEEDLDRARAQLDEPMTNLNLMWN